MFFFFKQKTAYEIYQCDWSSDVCSSDLLASVTDVVVLRTAAVAAQLEYLEVLAEAAEAWFELAAALNVSPTDLAQFISTGTEQQ